MGIVIGILLVVAMVWIIAWLFGTEDGRAWLGIGLVGALVVWGAASIGAWMTDNSLTETTVLNGAYIGSDTKAGAGQAAGTRTARLTGTISNNHANHKIQSVELRLEIVNCQVDGADGIGPRTGCRKQGERSEIVSVDAGPGEVDSFSTNLLFTNVPEGRAVSGKVTLVRARRN